MEVVIQHLPPLKGQYCDNQDLRKIIEILKKCFLGSTTYIVMSSARSNLHEHNSLLPVMNEVKSTIMCFGICHVTVI